MKLFSTVTFIFIFMLTLIVKRKQPNTFGRMGFKRTTLAH